MGAATDTLVLFMSASKVRIAQPSNSQQVKSASGQTRGRGQYHENQREQNDDEETGNSLDWMSGAGSKTGTNIFDCMGFVKPILASLVPQPTCYWKWVGGTKGSKRAFFSLTASFSAKNGPKLKNLTFLESAVREFSENGFGSKKN